MASTLLLIVAKLRRACAGSWQCLSLEEERAEAKGSGVGDRRRVRMEVAWARECKESTVGTGRPETLHLEGLRVKLVQMTS